MGTIICKGIISKSCMKTIPQYPPTGFTIEYIVVAGGGGGGCTSSQRGAGAGAGGFYYNVLSNVSVTSNFAVVVSVGGALSVNGSNSCLGNNIITVGGWREGGALSMVCGSCSALKGGSGSRGFVS